LTIFAFGLGVDEAHYMLYARFLDWSYFDHPPLVGWTHYIFNLFFGENEFSARLPAFLLGVVSSFYLYGYLKRYFSVDVALFGVLAMNASVMLNAMFLFLLPESFLLFFVFPIIYYVDKIEQDSSLKNYIWLGVWLGLAGLAKYSAVFFIPPILLYLAIKKEWKLIFSYKTAVVILLGLLFVSPVIYWNVENDFISFAYQGSHVAGSEFSLGKFFQSLGAQLSYSPLLFLVAVYGFLKVCLDMFKYRDFTFLLPALLSAFFAIFFIYFAFFDTVLPHWSALFYIIFIPIGSGLLLKSFPKVAKVTVYFSVVLLFIIFFELNFKLFPYKDFNTPFRDTVGWDEMMEEAKNIVEKNPNPKKAIAVANWTQGSRAKYYYSGSDEVFVLDRRYDQFDLWESSDFAGKDVLLIDTKFKQFNKDALPCKKIEFAGEYEVVLEGAYVNRAKYYWCFGFEGKNKEGD